MVKLFFSGIPPKKFDKGLLGRDLAVGKLPASEMDFIHQMVKDISYNNAKRYFDF